MNPNVLHLRRRLTLTELDRVSYEAIRSGEAVVKAAGHRFLRARLPIYLPPSGFTALSDEVLDQGPAGSRPAYVGGYEQVFQIADRGCRPCSGMEHRDGEADDPVLPYRQPGEDAGLRIEDTAPRFRCHLFRHHRLVEAEIAVP